MIAEVILISLLAGLALTVTIIILVAVRKGEIGKARKEVRKANQRAMCTASVRGYLSRHLSGHPDANTYEAVFAYEVAGVTYEIYAVLKYRPIKTYSLGPIPVGSSQSPTIPDLEDVLVYYNPEDPSQAYLPENQ